MKMKGLRVPEYVRFLLLVYLLGTAVFTIFRGILFLANLDQLQTMPADAGRLALMLRAFLMGFRFDTVISGYILVIPFVILSIFSIFSLDRKFLYRLVTFYLGAAYSLAFFICAADVPYFTYFNSRLSAVMLYRLEPVGFLVKMIIQDIGYWLYVFCWLSLCAAFWLIIIKIRKGVLKSQSAHADLARVKGVQHAARGVGFSILFMILLFVGMRGRLAVKSPIRVGTAYFSGYSFPNQLGLNPVFTFIRSCLDELKFKKHELNLMADEQAIGLVREYLGIGNQGLNPSDSPIARRVEAGGPPVRANVIVVMMESMSAKKLGELTPNLNSAAKQSYTFNRIYTSGIHTSDGILSSFFAFPTQLGQHPLKGASIPCYAGLPGILKENGYRTIYFITHDDQFDNAGGFLRVNGFEQIVSQEDYPSERILSTLGAADDFMFEFSIPLLNELHRSKKPFLAAFQTASDHPPYIIPQGIPFTPRGRDIQQRIVSYVDWAVGKFLHLASQQDWYKNTIFIFTADHGANLEPVYDMPLGYFHIPLIIYSPFLIKEPRSIDRIGGQIDIFPTLMGLLNIPYVNRTLGIDLLKETRPFIFFHDDQNIGCLNEEYYLLMRRSGEDSLYSYRQRDIKNYLQEKKSLVSTMKNYVYAMLQTSQWLTRNRKTGMHQ